MIEKLMSLDRRYVFALVGLAVIIPTLLMIRFPIYVSQPTQNIYDFIEGLSEGEVVMIAFDYGPSSLAELNPMAIAVLRHCFRKRLRVIGMTLWPVGATLGDTLMREVAHEFDTTEGEDYVYLGYRPGVTNVLLQMGEDISAVFAEDYSGTPISEHPMMADVKNYNDIALVVDLAAGASVEGAWIPYTYTGYKQKIAAGVTGVIVSQLYPYLQTGQLVGLMPGLLGAAEYEKLIEQPGKGTAGMSAQSIVHLLVIVLVIVGNVAYFTTRRREQNAEVY